jgi:hypothetical protein
LLCLLAGFAATPGCGEENNVTTNNSNTYDTMNNVTQVLGAQGGVENVLVGSRVDLPPGALTEEVSLVVAELADPSGLPLPAGTSGEGGGKSGHAGAVGGDGDGDTAGKVATLPPGCSTGFGLGGGLCQGKGKPIVWATAGELVASGDGGLEAPAGQGWTNVATAASFGPGEDFCVAWQAALGGGYNPIMAGVRFETFAGNFLDRGIYLDQPYTCLFFSPTDSFTNRCDSVAPGVTINHAAGECALVEVRRVAGQVDVAVNGEVRTSDAEDGEVTPSVLLYNSIGRISSACSY